MLGEVLGLGVWEFGRWEWFCVWVLGVVEGLEAWRLSVPFVSFVVSVPSTPWPKYLYLGFSERLALIPFDSPAVVGSSSCSDTVGSARGFSGTRRKRRGCRPNRTPAAGRRDRRQSIGPPQPFPSPRRARQAKPGASPVCGLPLVQPPRRFLPPRRSDGQRVCLPVPSQKIRDKGVKPWAIARRTAFLIYYAPIRPWWAG